MFKMALEIECMKAVIADEKWVPATCSAQHVVDPWDIHPQTVACTRQKKTEHILKPVDDLLDQLQVLLEFLSAAAILHGLFAEKVPSKRTLGTMPVHVPLTSPEPMQPQDAGREEEEDGDQIEVTQSFAATNL